MMAGWRGWLGGLPGARAARRLLRDRLLAARFRRRRFIDHYAGNYWRGDESRSGRGSALAATEAVRQALPALCRELGVRSLLDIPCGDFHWMRLVRLDGIAYTGVDIVPALVADLNHRYGGADRRFVALDAAADVLPRCDLILCRDMLVHLSWRDIALALRNFRRSGATWLLTTTFPARAANEDLLGRDWRPINLQRAPFHLPPPLRLIDERCTEDGGQYADKSLGLWRIADLP